MRSEDGNSAVQNGFATAGLIFGAAIVCLALVDATTGVPFRLPRSWYANRPIWYMIAGIAFVGGAALLRRRSTRPEEWRPAREGVRFNHLVLYTRENCRLCDDAREILQRYAKYLPVIEEVDIDADPELAERFGRCVPVVEIDGKVRFRGRVNEFLLRRLIEGAG